MLFFGWDALLLAYLYWCENAVIGVLTIPRIAMARYPSSVLLPLPRLAVTAIFILHYAVIMFVHAMILATLWQSFVAQRPPTRDAYLWSLFTPLADSGWPFALAFALMVASHVHRVVTARRPPEDVADEMGAPYRRVALLHFTVVLGTFVIVITSMPRLIALVFVPLRVLAQARATVAEDPQA